MKRNTGYRILGLLWMGLVCAAGFGQTTLTTQTANFDAITVQNNSGNSYAGTYNNGTELANYANQNNGSNTTPGTAAFRTFTVNQTTIGGAQRTMRPGDRFIITAFSTQPTTSGVVGISFKSNTNYTNVNDYINGQVCRFELTDAGGWRIVHGGGNTENAGATAGSDRTLQIDITSSSTFDATIAGTAYRNLSFINAGPITSFCIYNIVTSNGTNRSNPNSFWKNASLQGRSIDLFSPSDATISGTISNGGGENTNTLSATALNYTGPNNLTLSGLNTYSGTSTLSSGTLLIGNNDAFGTGGLVLTGGTILASGGSRTISNNITLLINGGTIEGANDLNLNGTLTNSGGTRTLTVNGSGTTNLSGNVYLAANSTPRTLNISGTGNITVGGVIANYNGIGSSGNLTKSGTGTLTLTNSNIYSGLTTLSAGTIVIGHNNALGTSGLSLSGGTLMAGISGLNISNNTSLQFNSTIGGANNLTISGSFTNSGANRTLNINNSGNTALAGNVFLSESALAGRTLNLSGTGNLAIEGIIGDFNGSGISGNLTMNGSGTLTLSNLNTYTGSTTISNGTLTLGASHAIPVGNFPTAVLQFQTNTNRVLNTGNFDLGTSTATANSAGQLDFDVNTTINLGSSNTLYFKASNGQTWDASTITINGWTGSRGGPSTGPRIFVGSDATGLSTVQLAKISFTGFGAGAQILSTGELVPTNLPAIVSFAGNPGSTNSGYAGSTVTITGSNFSNVTDVQANNVSVGSWTVVNETTITFTASATTSGNITVITAAGTATSAGTYTHLGYITAANGDWNTPATWLGNNLPPASVTVSIAHDITVNATVANTPNTVTIMSGGKLAWGASGILGVNNTFTNAGTVDMSAAGTLNMAAGSTFANGTATFIGSSGIISFAGAGTVSGTVTLPVVIANSGSVSFGANTVIGTALQLNAGGGAATPVYGSSSTLIYNGQTTILTAEWTRNVSSGNSVPYNVKVGDGYGTPVNTGLTADNTSQFRYIRGGLVITSGSSLTMGGTSGGNLQLEGDFLNNGSFTSNGRTVIFTGTTSSQINPGASTFTTLTIDKTSGGSATLTGNTTVTTVLNITNGKLNTNGFTLWVTATAFSSVTQGGVSTAFINGPLTRSMPGNVSNTFLFPVGVGSTYLPFVINSIAGGSSAVVTVTPVASAPSGSADGSTLQSLSGSEYWTATFTGSFTNMTVSLGRQSPLGSLNKIGRSSSNNGSGTFSSIGGTVSGTNINTSNVTGNILGSFAMAVGMPDPVISNVQHVSLSPAVAGQAANSGYVGQTLTITGSNYLAGFTSVTIGGAAAASFTIVDANTITAEVAAGATNGNVVVTNTATLGASTVVGFVALGYITNAAGTWSTNATWLNNSVPPNTTTTNITINHDVTGTSGSIATGALTVFAGKTLSISNGSTVTVNTGSTNSGTIDVSGTLAVASATYANSGALNILNGGNLQINQGGFYNGTAPVYNSTSSSLTFNNTAGQYGIATTHVYWPGSNGPVTVILQGAAGAQMQAGVSRTVTNLFLNSALDIQTAGGITVTGTLRINATTGAVTTNAPVYSGTNSTLSYNSGNASGTPYAVGIEWGGNSPNPGTGIPFHVKVGDGTNTFITMPNGNRGFGGDFTLAAGSGITLNATAGDLHIGGNFTNNATANFASNNREVIFNGSGIQSFTGTTTFTYLRINKPAGILNLTGSNASSITVNNRLAMPSGNISLGDNNLTLAAGATLEGVSNGTSVTSFSATNMVITGLAANTYGFLRRTANIGAVNLVWPIAESNNTSEYSPVTMVGDITTGGTVGYKVTDMIHPNNGASAEYLSRYWTISTTAGTATGMELRAYYQASGDLVGLEPNLRANVYFPLLSGWLEDPASTVGGVTYPLQIRMVLDNTTTALTTNDITARKEVPTLYRTITSGPWNNTSTWEVSIDGGAYGSPASAPTALNSTSIMIRSGHTITTSGAISLDQATIQTNGILNFNSGTITVFNGNGEDLVIENGGVFRHSFNSAIPTLVNVPTWRVKTGGMIHINTNSPGSQADAYASDELATYAASMIWENGSIFQWQSTSTLSTSGRNYFVNAGSDQGIIPIFRFSSTPSLGIGAGTNTVFNGLIEANASVTFQNAGSKILRNGIIGTGNVTQSSTSGVFIINGSTSQIGGTGTLNLNTTLAGIDGLQITNGICTLINNKVVNTSSSRTIKVTTSDATFNAQENSLTGTCGFEHTSNASTFITSHANGVNGSLGGLTGPVSFVSDVNYIFNGAGNQVTGSLMGALAFNLEINKNGSSDRVILTNNNTQVRNLLLTKGLFGAGSGNTLQFGNGAFNENVNTIRGIGPDGYEGNFVTDDDAGVLRLTNYTDVYGNSSLELRKVECFNNKAPSGIQFLTSSNVSLQTASVPVIKDYLKILSQGFISRSPLYGNGSLLIYANAGNYDRTTEWGNVPNTPGYPWHVTVEAGTTLYLGSNPVGFDSLYMGGDLRLGTNFGTGTLNMTGVSKPFSIGGHLIVGSTNNSGTGTFNMNDVAVPVLIKGNLEIGADGATGSDFNMSTTIGGDLWIGGNFTRYNGSSWDDPNERAVFFFGPNNGIISTPGVTAAPANNPTQYFNYVFLQKSSANQRITLNCPVGINRLLTLNTGDINTSSSAILSIRTGGTVTGGNLNSFVNGPIEKRTNNTGGNASNNFTFPVGKNGTPREYRPAQIAQMAHDGSNVTTYTAEYFQSGSTGSGGWQTNDIFTDSRLVGVYKNQYWMIDQSPVKSGVGGRVGLYYKRGLDEFFPVAFLSTSAVAPVKFYGSGPGNGSWEYTVIGLMEMNIGPYFEAIGGNTTALEWVYTDFLDAFSPFSIGFGDNRVLPLNLLSFTAALHGPDALLHWTLADARDLKSFEVEHSTDGQTFRRLATVGHNGGNYYNYKHTGLEPGLHYYRLNMVEKDGRSAYSKVEVLMVNTNLTLITGLLQNPIRNGQAVVKIYSASRQDAEAVVLDMAGRTLIRQRLSLQTGYNQPAFSLLPLPPGMYKLLIRTRDGVEKVLNVIR